MALLFVPPMIADLTLPPFTTILLIVGTLLMVLALAGQITVKQLTVGISQRSLRMLAGIIGAGFVGIAVWLFVFPTATISGLPSNIGSPTPPVALRPQKIVPLERYNELSGSWEIVETVIPPNGNYEIIWSYKASVLGNRLTMEGRKTAINEPGRVRPLRADEKATISIYTLDLNGFEGEGSASERDPNGVIISNVKVHFSDDLKSLSGSFETGGSQISTLMGSKQ
jgi:hypothetical protein